MDRFELQNQAEHYRNLYNIGNVDRVLAKEMIMPYLDYCNNKSIELCKKYNKKHKNVSFTSYVR